MRSWQFREYGAPLEPVDAPTPQPRGEEVLIRVEACGVCHSDLHLRSGFFDLGGGRKSDLSKGRRLPFTLGHEIVGTVAAAGPDAHGVKAGERRVVYPWIGCGGCGVCRAGDEHLCLTAPRQLGVNLDGGYADHVLVPSARYLHEYGDVAPELAATYACSGLTAFSALGKVRRLAEGRSLLIVGAGGVGLAALAIARPTIATTILVADVDPKKLEAAKREGADHTVNPADDSARKEVMRLTGGGAPAVVDFVGSERSAAFGFGVLGAGGKMVVVGLFGGALSLSIPLLPLKNLTLAGSMTGSPAEMAELMALARAGRVKPLPVTRRPLDEAEATLRDLEASRIVGRVVLEP